jgi:NADH-quinone oxidoreductase subunit M
MLAMAGAVLLLAVSGATRRTVIGVAIAGLIAGALMLAGVLALERHDHSLSAVHSFDMRPYHQLTLPAPLQNRVFLAFVPGLAMAPLLFALFARTAIAAHPWLMLPGVLALNVGVFGLFRVSLPMVPGASRTFLPLMLGVSILVAWSGAIASLLRTDWKRSIAGASIAYAALATFGTFALTPDGLTGSVVQHVSLALSLGAIFIIEGRLRQSAGGSDGRVPVMILVLIAACLSIAGMPLLAGFVGLRRSVEGVWPISRVAALAVVAAALVAAAGMGRLYARRTRRIQGSADGGPFPEVRFVEIALPAALASLSIWIGLYPAPLLGRLETSVARVVLRVSPQYAAQVADCLTQPAAPPPAAIPGLPAGMVMAAPCADGSNSPPPAAVK